MTLKSFILILWVGISPPVVLYAMWNAPVNVKADSIDIFAKDSSEKCNITKDEFIEYWKNAESVFQHQLHDYDESSSCLFASKENSRVYRIRSGGVGELTHWGQTYYYLRKGALSTNPPQ